VDFKHERFDQYGEYLHLTAANCNLVTEEAFFDALECFEVTGIVDDILDTFYPDNVCSTYVAHLSNFTPTHPTVNCSALSLFGQLLTPLSVRLK
jgi:hypothetical protein